MIKRVILFILSFSLSLTLVSGVSAQANTEAEPTGGFSIWPAIRNNIDIYKIIHEAKPGETSEVYVIVKNFNDTTENFHVYAADTDTRNGKTVYKTSNETQENIGKWINIEDSQIVLDPKEEKKIKATIVIPSDTVLDEYYGGIALEKVQQSENYAGLNIATRVILGVQLKITNTPQPVPQFMQASVLNIATPYFWFSVVIFVGSMAYFIWINHQEKKSAGKHNN